MNIILRADGSPLVGLGHLNRSLLLAQALRAEGSEATLLVRDDPAARSFLAGEPAIFLDEDATPELWPASDACLVDLYRFDDEYYAPVVRRYGRVAIYDDFGNRPPRGVSLVINPRLGATPASYPPGPVILAGARYFPLREEFTTVTLKECGESVFLCMGGSDPEGQTLRLCRVLAGFTSRPLDVLLGPGFDDDKAAAHLSAMAGVILHRSLKSPGSLMIRAAYAVCGGGSMLYELAALGIPTACLALSRGQIATAAEFGRQGAALYLGYCHDIDDESLMNGLKPMERDPDLRRRLAGHGRYLLDGQGARRTAQALIQWVGKD